MQLYIFIIRGHTKNGADRPFNLLKGGYHKIDIFTYKEISKIIDEKHQVQVTIINPVDFMKYTTYFSSFYKTPTSGIVKITHLFTA